MERLLSCVIAVLVMATPAAAESSRSTFASGVDLSWIDTSGLTSWTHGGVGKLRYDGSDDGLVLSRAFFDYGFRLADTVEAQLVLELYDDDLGAKLDFTEAYLAWRPVPRSENRYRLKVGAFYPNLSLENVDPGWSSPYSMNYSAINTWVGEELRTVGAEFTVSRRPASLGREHEFSLQAAAFVANDPTGSLLAWKGWSLHDRQSRSSDELPLPPLPAIQPGGGLEWQAPYVAPFREVDGRVGYYAGGEWKYRKQFLLRLMHYDNRAEPTAFERGQYAWYTEFNHVGAQLDLPAGFGAIAQWMRGSTVMGPDVDGIHMVDVDFESVFLLLTKKLGKHRVSVRYDRFDAVSNDDFPGDNGTEDGDAWTVSYRHQFGKRLQLGAEWLRLQNDRLAHMYYGLPVASTEEQLQLTLMLRFDR